jgi:hypothetical protein
MNKMFIKPEFIDSLLEKFKSAVEKHGINLHNQKTKFNACFLYTNEHS